VIQLLSLPEVQRYSYSSLPAVQRYSYSSLPEVQRYSYSSLPAVQRYSYSSLPEVQSPLQTVTGTQMFRNSQLFMQAQYSIQPSQLLSTAAQSESDNPVHISKIHLLYQS